MSATRSRRVLITRPQPAAGDFAERLRSAGFEAWIAPMTEYVEQDPGIDDLAEYQAVIFTSAQTVPLFARYFKDRYIPVFAVGDATAKAAQSENFRRVYSAHGDGQALSKLVREHKGELKIRRALHACGEDTAESLADQLQEDGIYVDRAPFYKAEFVDAFPDDALGALLDGKITTVTFLSARTASNFARLVKENKDLEGACADLEAVCISDRVATEAKALQWRAVHVAKQPQLDSVVELLEEKSDGAYNFAPMPAEAVIAAFGGLRPLANRLGIPPSTVQGWRQRGTVPETRMADILLSARAAGIDVNLLWQEPQKKEGEASSGEGQGAVGAAAAAAAAGPGDRRIGADRRKRYMLPDDRGLIRAGAYVGPDRRSGADRRSFQERQMQRITGEKWRFLNRTVVMTAFFLIAALYAGFLLLAPEFADMREKSQNIEAMQAQMDALNRRILELQTQQTTLATRNDEEMSIGQKLGARIGEVEQIAKNLSAAASAVTEPVTAAAGKVKDVAAAAAGKTGAGKNIHSFLQVLANVNRLSKTKEGEAAIDRALVKIRQVLAMAPAETGGLNNAVNSARGADKDLALLLGNVDARDLGAAALLLALNEFRGGIGANRSFEQDLLIMQKFVGDDPKLKKSLERLSPYAKSGILSRRQLQQEFEGLASDIVMAKLQGKDLDVQDQALKRLSGLVKMRKVDDVTGKSVDAVVARAQILLDKGDVKGAMRELQTLEGAPAQKAQPFLNQAAGNVMADDASAMLIQKVMEMFQGGGMGLGDASIDQMLQDAWNGGPLGIMPYLTGTAPPGGVTSGMTIEGHPLPGGFGGGVPVISPGIYDAPQSDGGFGE